MSGYVRSAPRRVALALLAPGSQRGPQQLILHWKDNLHPLVKIARHPVGDAQINLLLATIGKKINATVLEEAAHDASHADMIAYTPNTRA